MRLFRRNRKPEPEITFTAGMHNGEPIVACFIESETSREIEEDHRRWWDSLSPEEQAEHIAWEEEQTAMWLEWANEVTARKS